MLSQFALSTINRTGMSTAFHGAASTRTQRVHRIAVRFEDRVPEGAVVCALLRSAEAHNPGSAGHAVRVSRLAHAISLQFPLSAGALATIASAALLHDIGKIAIDADILRKPGTLTEAERATVRLHVAAGVRLLRPLPGLRRAAVLIRASHEWLNGAGYPRGVRGSAIPLGSRIVAVADAFDALTHVRVYSTPMEPALAVRQLRTGARTQFDPRVLSALERLVLSSGLEAAGRSFDVETPAA